MDLYRRSRQNAPTLFGYLALSATLILFGCASPGPPHAPSLQLPQPVRDLTATRVGNTVELHFTEPSNSTDKLALRGPALNGQLCRQLPHQPCTPAGPKLSIPLTKSNDNNNLVTITDLLPSSLAEGAPQLLTYRLQFFNSAGRSAGPSNEALTASGQAPFRVENFQAQGSRLGILLQWTPGPGDVVLERENLAPAQPKHTPKSAALPATVWLQANDSKELAGRTIDTTALPDTPYRYTAQRRITLDLDNHPIQLRSALSTPISFTLSRVYPPPAPTGLIAAGYSIGTPSSYAVDLIWQPIDDAGLVTPLAGYNLYRETLSPTGMPASNRHQLNTLPILQPSFHDATANPAESYRYSVTAVDAKGNESPAFTITLTPPSTP